jgi:hypothetical protein
VESIEERSGVECDRVFVAVAAAGPVKCDDVGRDDRLADDQGRRIVGKQVGA